MSKQEQLSSVHLPWFGIPRIARYFKPYRGMIAVMFACVLMNGLMDIILPLFQQYAIDVFVLGNTTQGIVPFTILYAALIVTEALLIRASISPGQQAGNGRGPRHEAGRVPAPANPFLFLF